MEIKLPKEITGKEDVGPLLIVVTFIADKYRLDYNVLLRKIMFDGKDPAEVLGYPGKVTVWYLVGETNSLQVFNLTNSKKLDFDSIQRQIFISLRAGDLAPKNLVEEQELRFV